MTHDFQLEERDDSYQVVYRPDGPRKSAPPERKSSAKHSTRFVRRKANEFNGVHKRRNNQH